MQTRFIIRLTAITATVILGACTFDTPTKINTASQIQVYEDSFTLQEDTNAVTPDMIGHIGNQYRTNGTGPMHVSVIYDPYSKTNTAMKAAQESKRIAAGLRSNGVADIQADSMPIQQSGDISQTMISFATVMAGAPADCPATMSRNMADLATLQDYKLGCSVETYMAKQIARPADLLGNDTMDNGDGRRSANVMEPYQIGKPNPELKGELATED